MRKGTWADRHGGLPMELSGKTALIVGFGRIGTRSARRCLGFDMNVLIYDPYVPAEKITAAGCETVTDLDAALPRADFVSIHCPKNARDDRHVQRGAVRTHEAWRAHRQHGAWRHHRRTCAARGADRPAISPAPGWMCSTWSRRRSTIRCFKLDTVITSPHMAGVTTESVAGMAVATAENILSVLDGTPNRNNAINPEVLD